MHTPIVTEAAHSLTHTHAHTLCTLSSTLLTHPHTHTPPHIHAHTRTQADTVTVVMAYDQDREVDDNILYSIISGNSILNETASFDINETTGVIFVNTSQLDRETHQTYTLFIEVGVANGRS